MNSSEPTQNNSNEGHRKRLREKFLFSGFLGFHDYEIIELLLTLGTPRKDCKLIAKDLIKTFGSLKRVLDADLEDLQVVKGVGPSNAFGLKLFQAVSERLAKENIPEFIDCNSTKNIAEFLQKLLGREKKEHFVVLYLDSKNSLIEHRIISIGTLNASLVHPREVFEPAVSLHASSIIVAHNHPSGNIQPSSEDRDITKKLIDSGRLLGIDVRDHIIFSDSNFFSFQQQLLI